VETDDDEDSHSEFSGLPSPAAAGVVAAFPFAMPSLIVLIAEPNGPILSQTAEWIIPSVRVALPLITAAAAGLMVSRIRYPHFFAQFFSGQRTKRHVIQLVISLLVVFFAHEALPLIFCWFAFASPLRAAWGSLVLDRLGLFRPKRT
jgi:CDP-diacylglycerol--serine O-phosphatidyltransferase